MLVRNGGIMFEIRTTVMTDIVQGFSQYQPADVNK